MGFTAQQLEQMQSRLKRSGGRACASAPDALRPAPRASNEVVLGIDPSLRGTGYGVIRTGGNIPATLAHGTIACPKTWERSRCLALISETLRDVIRQHQPTICVIEGIFFAQNLKTALIMGEARGAAIAAVAGNGLEIYEVATRKVKLAIVGYGGAQKLAVAKMVQRMLNLTELPAPDAADALALALTHAQTAGRFGLNAPKKI